MRGEAFLRWEYDRAQDPADVERSELSGPFAVGATITVKLNGQEPIESRIPETREPNLFTDEAQFAGAVEGRCRLRAGRGGLGGSPMQGMAGVNSDGRTIADARRFAKRSLWRSATLRRARLTSSTT
ncbi:MAG TPA: hypothetical protein VMK12_19430 [Anaeromyxobacteraceae bacterium]|nr:hypothetical protein [Anaeromyxobacteraceae bacterium]